jgi:hypothetical protein
LDLGCVILSVLRINENYIPQCHTPSFNVSAGFIEGLRNEMLEKIVVLRTQMQKTFQRIGRMTPIVAEVSRPKLLVESLEHRIRIGDQPPKSPRSDNLRIS